MQFNLHFSLLCLFDTLLLVANVLRPARSPSGMWCFINMRIYAMNEFSTFRDYNIEIYTSFVTIYRPTTDIRIFVLSFKETYEAEKTGRRDGTFDLSSKERCDILIRAGRRYILTIDFVNI